MFGFSKTDTAAVVGEVLQSGIGWMTLCPMVGSSQIPSKTATLGTTHRNCVREYVREDCAPQGPHSWNLLSVGKQ